MPSDERSNPADPTPVVGAETDIARPSRTEPKPAHERTAREDREVADWSALAASPRFKELLKAKRRFILPATTFFVVYYFALPYLVAYHPQVMQRKVWGEMNIAYLFALSQFFMAWIIAAAYVRAASRFDRMAAEVIRPATSSQSPSSETNK
ncbi:MAG: DUF485 domain-containing protein [Chthoniobacterales bacterium]